MRVDDAFDRCRHAALLVSLRVRVADHVAAACRRPSRARRDRRRRSSRPGGDGCAGRASRRRRRARPRTARRCRRRSRGRPRALRPGRTPTRGRTPIGHSRSMQGRHQTGCVSTSARSAVARERRRFVLARRAEQRHDGRADRGGHVHRARVVRHAGRAPGLSTPASISIVVSPVRSITCARAPASIRPTTSDRRRMRRRGPRPSRRSHGAAAHEIGGHARDVRSSHRFAVP